MEEVITSIDNTSAVIAAETNDFIGPLEEIQWDRVPEGREIARRSVAWCRKIHKTPEDWENLDALRKERREFRESVNYVTWEECTRSRNL